MLKGYILYNSVPVTVTASWKWRTDWWFLGQEEGWGRREVATAVQGQNVMWNSGAYGNDCPLIGWFVRKSTWVTKFSSDLNVHTNERVKNGEVRAGPVHKPMSMSACDFLL